jgi:hypothetical protein
MKKPNLTTAEGVLACFRLSVCQARSDQIEAAAYLAACVRLRQAFDALPKQNDGSWAITDGPSHADDLNLLRDAMKS